MSNGHPRRELSNSSKSAVPTDVGKAEALLIFSRPANSALLMTDQDSPSKDCQIRKPVMSSYSS